MLLATNVLTYHNDNARTGQDLTETTLTPANVNSADFGKLFTCAVDGAVYAQPLYEAGVVVPGQGTHNLVLAATEHDSVYAFDADTPGPPIWHDSFINPAARITSVPDRDLQITDLLPEVGITGTPVIDLKTNTLYLVAFTKQISGDRVSYVQTLHAVDVATGAEKFGSPVVIQASVPGSGTGSSNGIVSFNAFDQKQRAGLLLDHGAVYICWASFHENPPFNGWVIGYNAYTLQQVAVFNDTPDGSEGGIWQGAAAPAADSAGNIYVISGNGTFDANSATFPNQDYGDSVIKLSGGGAGGLTVTDYFTPHNQATLAFHDRDLGSGGPLLLPPQPGTDPNLLVSAGKKGPLYTVNCDNLGGYDPARNNDVQEIPQGGNGLYGDLAYFDGMVYLGENGAPLEAFQVADGLLSSAPVSQTSTIFQYAGATPSISADGDRNGILWAVQQGNQQGVASALVAFSATNLGMELYDSNQAGSRDQLSSAVVFEVPTVADGKVFVGTQSGLAVFGELPHSAPTTPPAPPVSASGIGMFDASTATWYLHSQANAGPPDAGTFVYGAPGWVGVVGDWSGHGATVGVIDPTTATWYLRNENSSGEPDAGAFQYGMPGWIPVVGDWTGSGHTGIGVFDPSTATWYLRNSATPGAPDFVFQYGAPGWLPVTGDWTGKGHSGIAAVDPTTQTWYLRSAVGAGAADVGSFQYGPPGGKPVTGDWTASGRTGIGVVFNGTWEVRNEVGAGAADAGQFGYGQGSWQPVTGVWSAGAPQQSETPLAMLIDQSRSARDRSRRTNTISPADLWLPADPLAGN
jgi:hypothetical protein